MTETNVRKSGRPRKRLSYLDDAREYDDMMDAVMLENDMGESPTKRCRSKDKSPRQRKLSPSPTKLTNSSSIPLVDDESNNTVDYSTDGAGDTPVNELSNHSVSEVSPNNSKSKKSLIALPRSGGFTCEICEKVCVDLASYKRHMKGHSSDRKFQCEICSKAFLDSCSLKRHTKVHGDERPFTCDICFKSFRDVPSLNRHQQTHTDRPRAFTCQTCGKSFTDKHGLTRHERTHTGLRPFECAVCGKTFSESGSFKRHEKIHIGIRKFSCIVCGKKFLEKQSLLRHQRVVCGVTEDTTKSSPSFSHSRRQSDSSLNNLDSSTFSDITPEDGDSSLQAAASMSSKESISTSESNKPLKKPQHADTKTGGTLREEPSLQSLMKKDPSLYAGISDLVDSIDSYEQMLDLCGDNGHSQIEAALTRDPEPMPDSLLCFECGEHLVDGENFNKAGKTFRLPLKYQFKCLNCEEDETGDSRQPPSLAGGQAVANNRRESVDIAENGHNSAIEAEDIKTIRENGSATEEKSNKNVDEVDKHDLLPTFPSRANITPGKDDNLQHLRESLRAQHIFLGEMYPHLARPPDDTDSTTATSTNASVSRSSSTDGAEPCGQDPEPTVTFPTPSIPSVNTTPPQQLSHTESHAKDTSIQSEVASPRTSSLPQPLYAADQASIPSVFPCHLCTKVFATPAFLARHLYLHKNSPHKCMICSKTFTNGMSLRRHITMHTGEKPYGCLKCAKRFRDPSNFSKHKKICTAVPSTDISALVSDTPVTKRKRGRPRKNEGESALIQPRQPEMRFSYDVDASLDTQVPAADFSARCAAIYSGHSGAHPDPRKDHCDNSKVNVLVNFDPHQGKDASIHTGTHGSADNCDATMTNFDPDPDGNSEVDEDDVALQVTFGDPAQSFSSQVSSHYSNVGEDNEDSWTMSEDQHFVSETENSAHGVPVHCGVCERSFLKEKDLQRHMRFHTAENPELTCEECGKSFSDINSLKRHTRIHADTRPHVCEFCHRGYCDNWSLRKHQSRGCLFSELQVPANFMVPCPQCNRMFATAEMQVEHVAAVHKGELKFECDICLKRFSEAFNLKRHRRLHMAVCMGCEREFKDVKLLAEHQRSECPGTELQDGEGVAVKEDSFPCPECGRVYTTKANLERHKKFHSALKPFACELCSKRFSEAFKLKRHMKVHSELKPHVCPNCNKGFSNSQGLRQHLHKTRCLKNTFRFFKPGSTNPPPLTEPVTPVAAPKPAPSTPAVQSSRNSSSGFPCELCGKVFLKKFLLVRHMNVHSAEKPYICGQCGRAYKDTSSLKRHCLVHRGVKGFICPDCGKAFYYSDSLRRHRNGLCGRTTLAASQLPPLNASSGRKRGRKKKPKRNKDILNNNNDNEVTANSSNKPSLSAEETSCDPAQQQGDNTLHEPDRDETDTPKTRVNGLEFRPLVEPDSQDTESSPPSRTVTHQSNKGRTRLPPRRQAPPAGPWSCIKGGYCWRCSVYFPSNSALVEHVAVHRHNKPYFSRHSFHRWARKWYLTSKLSRSQGPARMYAASRPEQSSPGLKMKIKLLPKDQSEDTTISKPGDEETEENMEDSNPRPKRSMARARWSWLSQIH